MAASSFSVHKYEIETRQEAGAGGTSVISLCLLDSFRFPRVFPGVSIPFYPGPTVSHWLTLKVMQAIFQLSVDCTLFFAPRGYPCTPKMEALCFSETSVNLYQPTRHLITEDNSLCSNGTSVSKMSRTEY